LRAAPPPVILKENAASGVVKRGVIMEKPPVIDGHAHACGEYLTAEGIERKLTAAGVDQVLLTPGQYGSKTTYGLRDLTEKNPLGDTVSANNRTTAVLFTLTGIARSIPKGNEAVYQLRRALPDRVRQCYWVTRAAEDRLAADYERMRFDTVKLHQCAQRFRFDEPFFLHTASFAAERGLPLFLHVRSLAEMGRLIPFIKSHPETVFVIGHLYGMELFMQEERQYFANTYFDLSNRYFVSAQRILLAYRHFGAAHLTFGSDTPYGVNAMETTLARLRGLGLPEDDLAMITGGNLAALLRQGSTL
jgi:predicted TIM-barrel fold metal-dependent hydrolase